MLKMLFFLLGCLLTIIGIVFLILYANYLTVGYTFIDYLNMIIKRLECFLAPIGIIIIGIIIIKE